MPSHSHTPRAPTWFLVASASVFALASGCGPATSSAPNSPPSITSVGPVEATDDGHVAIHYALLDREGNEVDIAVEVRNGDGQGGRPAEGPSSDGTDFLPTVPAGESVPHRFVWDVACGFRSEEGSCNALDGRLRDQSLRATVSLADHDGSMKTEAFRLSDLLGDETGD